MTEKVEQTQDQVTVTLDTPIQRGQTTIDKVTIRRPRAGELRGIRIVDLANLDVGSLVTLLPRITLPSLTKPEVENLDPADLTALAQEVALFLVPKKVRADIQ